MQQAITGRLNSATGQRGLAAQRILYLQYTNPAGYPPLEHSSRLLAERGWQVLFLGTEARGANAGLPPHPNIQARQLRYCLPGWRQKLHYLWFLAWTFAWTLRWRPLWVYASDPFSCPSGLLAKKLLGRRVIYHEHDSPWVVPAMNGPDARTPAWTSELGKSRFMRLMQGARRHLARCADLCILPNEQRVEKFRQEMGRHDNVVCVWNCPERAEAGVSVNGHAGAAPEKLRLYYHGTISPGLVPISLVQALALLPEAVELWVAGYETIGHPGHSDRLREEAQRLGVEKRLRLLGYMPRGHLAQYCSQAQVGIALMPRHSSDVNRIDSVGASNKPFDYLAAGLPLLVSDLPRWKEVFVDGGCALACNPDNAEDIARVVRWYHEHPRQRGEMGERGRQHILKTWNYEAQFEAVLPVLGL